MTTSGDQKKMNEIQKMKQVYKDTVNRYLSLPPEERQELEPSLVDMETALRSLGVDV